MPLQFGPPLAGPPIQCIFLTNPQGRVPSLKFSPNRKGTLNLDAAVDSRTLIVSSAGVVSLQMLETVASLSIDAGTLGIKVCQNVTVDFIDAHTIEGRLQSTTGSS